MVRHVRRMVIIRETFSAYSENWFISAQDMRGGVQVNEILTPLTFSEVSRPDAYSRRENKHTQTSLRCNEKIPQCLANSRVGFHVIDKPGPGVVNRLAFISGSRLLSCGETSESLF